MMLSSLAAHPLPHSNRAWHPGSTALSHLRKIPLIEVNREVTWFTGINELLDIPSAIAQSLRGIASARIRTGLRY